MPVHISVSCSAAVSRTGCIAKTIYEQFLFFRRQTALPAGRKTAQVYYTISPAYVNPKSANNGIPIFLRTPAIDFFRCMCYYIFKV